MTWEITFFVNSILLGIGLAMDAFSVSLANGLREPAMRRRKMAGIAGVFAGFQALMPMIGWVCVHTIAQKFHAFEAFIPWIALALLGFIGGSMLISGIRGEQGTSEGAETGSSDLTESLSQHRLNLRQRDRAASLMLNSMSTRLFLKEQRSLLLRQ